MATIVRGSRFPKFCRCFYIPERANRKESLGSISWWYAHSGLSLSIRPEGDPRSSKLLDARSWWQSVCDELARRNGHTAGTNDSGGISRTWCGSARADVKPHSMIAFSLCQTAKCVIAVIEQAIDNRDFVGRYPLFLGGALKSLPVWPELHARTA